MEADNQLEEEVEDEEMSAKKEVSSKKPEQKAKKSGS
eukprot:CAMPEP_0168624520 /NCGR_PEP_ID=MMETSP0449_2-20121227/9460_1 /TAXON_ID=1082188 /ORGANISM="Strombidium rassoulzadegani, Strain ras09" /LENGTH=36 /DNA_ID= /DNA_START= /DNA_END= /DNA_ORIENTATION=